jgi:hypothetical protein
MKSCALGPRRVGRRRRRGWTAATVPVAWLCCRRCEEAWGVAAGRLALWVAAVGQPHDSFLRFYTYSCFFLYIVWKCGFAWFICMLWLLSNLDLHGFYACFCMGYELVSHANSSATERYSYAWFFCMLCMVFMHAFSHCPCVVLHCFYA